MRIPSGSGPVVVRGGGDHDQAGRAHRGAEALQGAREAVPLPGPESGVDDDQRFPGDGLQEGPDGRAHHLGLPAGGKALAGKGGHGGPAVEPGFPPGQNVQRPGGIGRVGVGLQEVAELGADPGPEVRLLPAGSQVDPFRVGALVERLGDEPPPPRAGRPGHPHQAQGSREPLVNAMGQDSDLTPAPHEGGAAMGGRSGPNDWLHVVSGLLSWIAGGVMASAVRGGRGSAEGARGRGPRSPSRGLVARGAAAARRMVPGGEDRGHPGCLVVRGAGAAGRRRGDAQAHPAAEVYPGKHRPLGSGGNRPGGRAGWNRAPFPGANTSDFGCWVM